MGVIQKLYNFYIGFVQKLYRGGVRITRRKFFFSNSLYGVLYIHFSHTHFPRQFPIWRFTTPISLHPFLYTQFPIWRFSIPISLYGFM